MKRIIYLLLTALIFIGMLSACQKTPESPIVVGKNADNLIEQATGDDGSAVLPLREQLSAPDMMDVTVEEDHFTILAHAAVRLPETDTIPMITVKAGYFSQELINRLWDLLIGDKPMYKPFTEADRTKAELEQAILTLQGDMERIKQNEYYEENKALREAELAHLQELYSTAPDTYEPVAVTSEIGQYVDPAILTDFLWGWMQRTTPELFSVYPTNRGMIRLGKGVFKIARLSIERRDTTALCKEKPAQRK